MSGNMPKAITHKPSAVARHTRRFDRLARYVRNGFGRFRTRLHRLEATVEPLVDHVGYLEEMLHDLERRLPARRRGRRAA